MEEIIKEIVNWGNEKGISNPEKQLDKMHEETREATTALAIDEILEENTTHYHLVEEIGDMGVVWILLCNMLDIDPRYALETAYNKNKGRKGKLIKGSFVKEEDL